MSFYSLLIFLHVLGGVGLFAAIGIEAVALRRLERAAGVDQALVLTALLSDSTQIAVFTMGLTFVAGVWMMAIQWGPEPWIVAALAAFAVMAIIAVGVTRPAIRRLVVKLRDGSDGLPPDFSTFVARGSLMAAHSLRAALAVGILGLMTIKPDVFGSSAIVGAAAVMGIAMALHGGAGKSSPMSLTTGVGHERRKPSAKGTGQDEEAR